MGIKASPEEIDAFLALHDAGPGTGVARTECERCTLVLPWPLVLGNNCKIPVVRKTKETGKQFVTMVPSSESIRWRKMVAEVVLEAGLPHVGGRFRQLLIIHPPNLIERDMDNVEKVMNDALKVAGVIDGDGSKHLRSKNVKFGPVKPNGELVVRIRKYGENYGGLFDASL